MDGNQSVQCCHCVPHSSQLHGYRGYQRDELDHTLFPPRLKDDVDEEQWRRSTS